MIGQLNDMTNIKLPKVFYISNGWVILGVFTITIVTLLICSFIFGFLMDYTNKKNTQQTLEPEREDGYDVVDTDVF